jgi:hypothetical protein
MVGTGRPPYTACSATIAWSNTQMPTSTLGVQPIQGLSAANSRNPAKKKNQTNAKARNHFKLRSYSSSAKIRALVPTDLERIRSRSALQNRGNPNHAAVDTGSPSSLKRTGDFCSSTPIRVTSAEVNHSPTNSAHSMNTTQPNNSKAIILCSPMRQVGRNRSSAVSPLKFVDPRLRTGSPPN